MSEGLSFAYCVLPMRSPLFSSGLRTAAFLATALSCAGAGTTGPTPSVCPAEEQAAFAFWEGTWDYSVPGFDPAVSVFTRTNNGCQLDEQFVDIGGQKQHTTITWDADAQVWKRHVVDPFRSYSSQGHFDGATIHFFETATARESYQLKDPTHLRFFGESSSDGGTNWSLLFDATYTKRSP
jgi:hypothetical protein